LIRNYAFIQAKEILTLYLPCSFQNVLFRMRISNKVSGNLKYDLFNFYRHWY